MTKTKKENRYVQKNVYQQINHIYYRGINIILDDTQVHCAHIYTYISHT
jgi:hypothetical protein